MIKGPGEGGCAVLERGGAWGVDREAIVDDQGDQTCFGEAYPEGPVRVFRTGHKTTTMQVERKRV